MNSIQIITTPNEYKKDSKNRLKNYKQPNLKENLRKKVFSLKEFLIKNKEIINLLIKIYFSIFHNHPH